MADLHFKIRADVSELNKAYKTIDDFEKKIVSINKALGEVNPGSKKFKELAKELAEVEKQYEKSVKRIAELENIVNSLNESQKLVNTTKEVTVSTNEATQVFVKYAGSMAELDRRVKELTKEYLSMNAAQKGSSQGQGVINEIAILNSQRKIEADSLRALQKEYVNTQRIQDLQEGSITALRAQLSQLTATYDNLGRSMRNSASGKELVGTIQTVTKELNEAEQASMRFNRNVGNYASGWNGLNMQVQQVARELPSLAIGANTFFLAISNNLPMLGDELKRAKEEFKVLKAEGKNATPVWKQVVSSLFSWQTALVAGVTIFAVYGKEIWNWTKSLFSAEVQLEKLSSAEEQLAESRRKGFKDSIKEKTELDLLYKASQDHSRSLEDRKNAVDKLQELFPAYFGNLKDEKILAGEAAGAYSKLATQILATANARAIADKIHENSSKIFDMRGELAMELAILKQLGDARIKANEEYNRKAKEGFGTATSKIYARDAITQAEIEFKQQEKVVNAIITQREKLKKINESLSKEVNVKDLATNVNNPIKEPTKKPYFDSYQQAKEIEKASQSIKDAVIKSETDILQQQIDLMDEGSNKQLAQIRLNYEKRFSEIQKEERELLQKLQDEERKQWEKKNPKFKEKNLQFTATVTTLPQDDRNRFDTEYSLAYQKQDRDTKAFFDKILKKYQDFAAQRESIEKQYNNDIAVLQSQRTDANTDEIDRAITFAQEKMKEAIQKINDDEATSAQKDNPFLKRLFGDYSQMKFDDLQKLIEEAKQLQSYLSGNTDAEGLTFITKDQLSLISKSPAELDKLQKALNKLLKGGKTNSWDMIFENFSKGLAKLKSSKSMKDISAGMQDIGEAASEASSVISGVAGSLSEMFEAMGNTEAADAVSGVQEAMTSISNIGQGFAKGGIVGGIAAAVGEAANFIGKAFAATARHKKALKEIMNEATAQQRAYNLLLLEQNLLYERGTTIFGTDAYSKAKNAVNNMRASIASLNKELAGTIEQKNNQRKDSFIKRLFGFQDINAALKQAYAGLANIEIKTGHKKTGLFGWGKGKDIYSSILDVYPQLIDANGKFNTSLAETILSSRTMSDDNKAAFQNMIDLAKQAEEAYKALSDYMKDIFGDLGNTMSDALVDAFVNGTDAAKAFTDSVSNMLETLAKQIIYSVTLAPIIEKAQKQMMDVMQNNGLSDKQKFEQWAGILDSLVDGAIEQQGYANSLYAEFKKLASEKGFDIFSPDKGNSQSSTKGTFQTMSQDVGNELSGRFTAFNISNDGILNQSILHTELLSSINEKMPVSQGVDINTNSDQPSASPMDELKEILTANYTQNENFSLLLTGQIALLAGEVIGLKEIVDEMRTKQVEQLMEISDVAAQ